MTSDRAPIIAPPPLIGLACILLAFVAKHYQALPIFPTKGPLQSAVGIFLVVVAIAIFVPAVRIFIAHGTSQNPYRPTQAIVTTGVYRFSRNPIYIAFLLIVLAFGLFANSYWFLVAAAVFAFVMHFGVVKREEKYLLEKFGDSYREYCRRVRPWI
jgi:protein-S-isoprenylcysteine O-methyltransferase Ste14